MTVDRARRPRQPSVGERVALAAARVGGQNELARLLQVSKSAPSRWRTGADHPSPEAMRALLALDYVLARLAEVMTPEQIQVWLTSPNPHLAGARPVDVVVSRGPLAVDDAIVAFEADAPV